MKPKNKKDEQVQPKDFIKEYNEIFHLLNIDPSSLNHEWNKEGDIIRELSFYENQPTPVLTSHTIPL